MKRCEPKTVSTIILCATKWNPRTRVPVKGRTTVVDGLVITPEFEGWLPRRRPRLNSKKFRLGTIDGYALFHFRRLKDARHAAEMAAGRGLCFVSGQRDLRSILRWYRQVQIALPEKSFS